MDWPEPIFNVEATAIARVRGQFYFVYAERDDNAPSTFINWAPFDPDFMEFGEFQSVALPNPDPENIVRAVVGMDIDWAGNIFTVASFDPEAAGLPGDPDFGPFRSSVWRIGSIGPADGGALITLAGNQHASQQSMDSKRNRSQSLGKTRNSSTTSASMTRTMAVPCVPCHP